MRVCDWIANFLSDNNVKNIYGLMGGGAAGLNDGFIKNQNLNYICFHHEQGAGHAAVGEAKVTRRVSVVNPTTGCGGTNCITSLLNAWQDSVPVIFVSGNVKSSDCSRTINDNKDINIRKYGIQEHDIIGTVKSLTKYAEFLDNALNVKYVFQKAFYVATNNRPGPVWIDIPADIQVAELPDGYDNVYIDYSPEVDINFCIPKYKKWSSDASTLDSILLKLSDSKRPIILAGQGIKQSNTETNFIKFVNHFNVPFVSTYGARDLLPFDHKLNVGAIGIKGSRSGNFAMQAADFLLSLGCSINVSHIGYQSDDWAPISYKILVDIDENELDKDLVKWDLKFKCNLKHFFEGVNVRI